jgi:hypothetical protein
VSDPLCGRARSSRWARRIWPFLLPPPLGLAALSWHGWEFSAEAFPLAVGIAVFGYLGVAIGVALRRSLKRTSSADL